CFLSSRRRHTRWPRDWSSDVCSSDLRRSLLGHDYRQFALVVGVLGGEINDLRLVRVGRMEDRAIVPVVDPVRGKSLCDGLQMREIGRASCRERGEASAVFERWIAK